MAHCFYWAGNLHCPDPLVLMHFLYIQMALEKHHFPEAHRVLDVAKYAEFDYQNVFQNL